MDKLSECSHLMVVAIVFFILHCAYCLTHDITINLDAGSDGKNEECGKVINLMAGNETTVIASGNVPQGDCMVAFRAMSNKKYNCNRMCVVLRNKKMETCDVQVRFTAIYFSKSHSDVKVFSCKNRFTNAWCPEAEILQVNIVENDEYRIHAIGNQKRLYEFIADVSPVCTVLNTGEITAESAYYTSKSRQITEEREHRTRVEGVVVAVCLSSIFLVVMFVFYCYYKSKALDLPPDPNQEYTKVSAFTGFRTKFLPKRRKKSRKKSEEEPHLISNSPNPATSQDYIVAENPQKVSRSSAGSATNSETPQGITNSTATLEVGAEAEVKPLVGKDTPDGDNS